MAWTASLMLTGTPDALGLAAIGLPAGLVLTVLSFLVNLWVM